MEKNSEKRSQLTLSDWRVVRKNESTVIFGEANSTNNKSEFLASDEKISWEQKWLIRFQFQRDLNDYILSKHVREGHHFHVPFVDFDKKGHFFLNREKKQTMIDAKSLDIYQVTKSIDTEIQELASRAPGLADELKKIRDKVFLATDSLIQAWIQEDLESDPPKRHKYVRFRSQDLMNKQEDLNAKERHEIIKRRDSMKALYNMLGPQRVDFFDESKDTFGPYLRLNNSWRKYICWSFLDIVKMYDDNDFLKGYKVFDENNYKSYISQVQSLYKTLETEDVSDEFTLFVDEELMSKMINFLFSKHKKISKMDFMIEGEFDEEGYNKAKKQNNNLRNNKWTFADFLVSKFYLDNMYSQDYLQQQYGHAKQKLKTFQWFKKLEEKYDVWFSINTRKKDLLSQLVKLLRSTDTDSISDQIWLELSYYFKDKNDEWTKKEADFLIDLSMQIAKFSHEFTKLVWKEYRSIEFAYKWDFVPNHDISEQIDSIKKWLNSEVRVSSRVSKSKAAMTGSNGKYSDFKWVIKFGTYTQIASNDPCMIWMEIQVKKLWNENDRGIQNHYFNRKQRFIEVFGRDRSHFSLKQYMEFFDDALKKAATNLHFRKKILDGLTDSRKKEILKEKRELDCYYPVMIDDKILKVNLLDLDSIEWKKPKNSGVWNFTDRELADMIAYSQLEAEIWEWRYKFLAYEKDIIQHELESMEWDCDNKVFLRSELLQMPDSLRYPNWETKEMHMVSKNYKASLKAGHLPASTVISSVQPSGMISSRRIPQEALLDKMPDIYLAEKPFIVLKDYAGGSWNTHWDLLDAIK